MLKEKEVYEPMDIRNSQTVNPEVKPIFKNPNFPV